MTLLVIETPPKIEQGRKGKERSEQWGKVKRRRAAAGHKG